MMNKAFNICLEQLEKNCAYIAQYESALIAAKELPGDSDSAGVLRAAEKYTENITAVLRENNEGLKRILGELK
jgi:hypothetical protein